MNDEIPDRIEDQCLLLLRDDHQLHEEIIRSLQDAADPQAVPFLRHAMLMKPSLAYLDYDDYGAYYKKCFWALRAIGTPAAIAVIEEFADSPDPVIQEQARYRLSKIGGQAPENGQPQKKRWWQLR